MAEFNITTPDGSQYRVTAPDGASEEDVLARVQAQHTPRKQPEGFAANAADLAKSVPGGMLGGLSKALSAGGQAEQLQMGQPVDVPSPEATKQILQNNVTGQLPTPQGRFGDIGASVGEALGNPGSYVGPGGAVLKLGGAALSGAGSEIGRQAAEGTPYETPASIAGALTGGAVAGKIAGPTVAKAAIPTLEELQGAARGGYRAARNSGLEVDPSGMAGFAGQVRQELSGPDHGFNPKLAGKTFDVLDELQAAPAGAVVTASNLDTVRKTLQNIAKETQPAQGGFAKPTSDAAAATIALGRLKEYMAGPIQDHALAGDPTDYVRSINQANGDFAAASRLRNVDARLNKAENATDRQVAGSLDSQIKSKVGGMLDNPERLRGLNDAERDQLRLINGGGPVSNTLRQLGRGGAGVVPLAAQLITGAATGGAFMPQQAALAAGLFAARKGSEAITVHRANELAKMLAKRSPEYESRVAAAGPPDTKPQKAALIRALLGTQ